MSRRPVIIGNWKMYHTTAETRSFLTELKTCGLPVDQIEIGLCPPFTSLPVTQSELRDTAIGWGGQNMHWANQGAYTGEISSEMLLTLGCRYVILGHSERRAYFGEDNDLINKKVVAALAAGLTPILCVGETLEQHTANQTEAVVERQLSAGSVGLTADQARNLIVAYEPIWAIGTGQTATPEQANVVHAFLRAVLDGLFAGVGDGIRIQYGGSVKPDNAAALLAQPHIDGALVGGASLEVASFAAIVRAAVS